MTSSESETIASGPDTEEALRGAVQEGMPQAIADLSRLVRIPSVSWQGYDPAPMSASAELVRDLLAGTGAFDDVRIARASVAGADALGQPAVLATRAARPGRPTVLLYAHHDVQPPGLEQDWESPAFEPTLRGGRLYGRGAADDKAGVLAHVAAIRAVARVLGDRLGLGLAVFVEGEEESGSPSFSTFLHEHRDALASDVIVVADSDNWSTETPSLTVGLRGNVTFQLTVSTLGHASHSGMFGGAVPDAMLATVRLLSTLYDEDGAVAVDGLERREAETPEYTEDRLRAEAALLDGVSPIGRGSLPSRMWNQPSVTITGIDAPSVRDASNTLLPSVTVVVSVRVAPGQRARDAFAAVERHLRAHAPFGAHLEFSSVSLGDPFLVDTSGAAVGLALSAMADAWGSAPVQVGVGGSIPFIADLVELFPQAQILVTGVEDPDTRAHSPNESLHLGVFARAILTEALLLARLNDRVESDGPR